MNLSESKTKNCLMQAFAGECQANYRYITSAEACNQASQYMIEAVFKFTAKQELAHAKVFYDYLKGFSGKEVPVEGNYPVFTETDPAALLRDAVKNESHEHNTVYADFASVAEKEGFTEIADKFRSIAEVEKTHSDRFKAIADLLEQQKLFVSDIQEEWVCLNCGYRFRGTGAPASCPVCGHPKGYFIRAKFAPYSI